MDAMSSSVSPLPKKVNVTYDHNWRQNYARIGLGLCLMARRSAVSELHRVRLSATTASRRLGVIHFGRAHQAAVRSRSRAIFNRACSHSHPSALPHPAISSLTVIAALIAQCPWITRESWMAVTPSRAAAAAIVRSPPCRVASGPMQPSGMRRIATHGRVLYRRYLSHVHPLVTLVLIADSADIRAVYAERDAPALGDAHAPFVGGPPVQALQPIGWSRQRPRRPWLSSADRIACSCRTCAGATPLASLRLCSRWIGRSAKLRIAKFSNSKKWYGSPSPKRS